MHQKGPSLLSSVVLKYHVSQLMDLCCISHLRSPLSRGFPPHTDALAILGNPSSAPTRIILLTSAFPWPSNHIFVTCARQTIQTRCPLYSCLDKTDCLWYLSIISIPQNLLHRFKLPSLLRRSEGIVCYGLWTHSCHCERQLKILVVVFRITLKVSFPTNDGLQVGKG